jgi:hypothetical protein
MKIGLLCVLTVLAGNFAMLVFDFMLLCARTVRTQSNPIFMSLYATARLEILSAQQGLNKFALKSKLYIYAIRQAFDELQQLKSATA